MYKVELSRRAFKSLKKLDLEARRRVFEKLVTLREEPIPRGAVKLRGEEDAYRLRVGDYRILYKVLWDEEAARELVNLVVSKVMGGA